MGKDSRFDRLIPFAVAGIVGLAVDSGVLVLVADSLGAHLGRLASFSAAVLTTWAINRRITFRHRVGGKSIRRELAQYVLANLGGGAVNLATYSALAWSLALPTAALPLAVAAGSLAGMMVNFTLADRVVYRRPR